MYIKSVYLYINGLTHGRHRLMPAVCGDTYAAVLATCGRQICGHTQQYADIRSSISHMRPPDMRTYAAVCGHTQQY